MQGRFRLKLLAAAVGMGVTGAAMAAAPVASAQTGATVALTQAPQIKAGTQVLGTVAASHPIHIEVALKMRNKAQLHTFIHNAHSPSVLVTKRALTPAQFRANYSPTSAQANKVAAWLRSQGFTNVKISANRMLVSADGTSSNATQAFDTHFARVRTRRGHVGFMNTAAVHIPGDLKGSVLSVVGLQNVHYMHPLHVVYAGGASTMADVGHDPVDFSAIYGGTGVNTASGVPVGIVTSGSLSQTIADLNTFTSNNGLAQVATQVVNTNGSSSDTSGIGEWNLDSQDIVGMAGGQVGKIIFYNIPSLSNANMTADFNKIVSDNTVKVINVSLGECETSAQQDGSAAADDQIFQQAVAQGQTFSVSTGDSGADECGDGGTTPSWPAASQYVVAVAGTRLSTSGTTWQNEVVWNDLSSNNGATGGSESTFEPQPSWQNGLFSGSYRGVADVAFDASPSTGSLVIVNGSTEQIGGTSLASPLFVGFWARVLAAKGENVGFAAPLLYQLPAADFHDITSGNNDGEQAGPGYDLATGLGSIIINKAIADIGGGSTPPPSNNPPTAAFTDSVNGLSVSFTNTSSDSDGSIASRTWDFGDGQNSTSVSPSHTYSAAGTYTVTLTVTDNDGATDSVSHTVTVSGGGSGGSNVLQNGVPITGISGSQGQMSQTYEVNVPAGASNLVISESGGTGDADLYVKFGSAPTTSSYDCRPYLTGNNESCSFSAPQAGTYYVTLNGYQNYSGVSLEATWTTGGSTPPPSNNGTFDNPTNTSIPDGGSVTSHINVTGEPGAAPSDLQVHVSIVHPYSGDLRITLIAPSGASVVLKNPSYWDSTANVNQTWTVDASSVQGNGTWKLKVDDVYTGYSGYLDDWSLKF
ncbi:MAG TPA: protease pro-enzyme activation domain-containing protein [Rhodanobacteraceae bacterium]